MISLNLFQATKNLHLQNNIIDKDRDTIGDSQHDRQTNYTRDGHKD